jgi:DNA-binding NarL/FixJ family response regulator
MMQRGESTAEKARLAFSPTIEQTYRRILLFVSPPGSVSDAMTAAIEREFPWISVRHVPEPAMACAQFDADVQLILIDQSMLDALRDNLQKLASYHPGAMKVVMTTAKLDLPDNLIQIIGSQGVRGILPTDVNLDIWLSIIRIVLKGGEYFPSALFQRMQRIEPGDRPLLVKERPQTLPPSDQWSETMDELTGRELEVLAMVARGHQNKIIAAELGLSEHTVKIHLHNIIRKLGVHNRTEAAARYFEYTSSREEADDDAADRNGTEWHGRPTD